MTIAASLVGTRGEIGSGSSVTTGSGTTSSSGSTFVICLSWFPTANGGADLSGTPGDNKGNTYTQIGSTHTTANGDLSVGMWRKENGSGGSGHTATANFANSNAFASIELVEITGATVPTLDKQVGNATSSDTPYTLDATGTLSNANEVIISWLGADTGSSFSWSSSNTTLLDSQGNGNSFWPVALSKLVVSATSSIAPVFARVGDGTSHQLAFQIATFYEGGSGSSAALSGSAGTGGTGTAAPSFSIGL